MLPRSPRLRWASLLLCLLALGTLLTVGAVGAQDTGDPPPPSAAEDSGDGTTDPAAEDSPTGEPSDDSEGEDGAGDATGDTAEGEASRENVLRPLVRFLSASQSQLEEDTGLESWLLYGLALVAAYFLVVSIVLFVWRRARKPAFWKQGLEEIEGEGRWQCQLGYDIRRKVDAMLELKILRVEPSDATPQLACLVADTVKGRLSTGSAIKIGFPHIRPRSFWQTQRSEEIGVGFELIQPRDQQVKILLDCRVEYAIRRRKSTGGAFEVNLEFQPTTDALGQLLQNVAESSSTPEAVESLANAPKIEDTAAVKVIAAGLSGEFAAPPEMGGQDDLDDLRRNQELLDQRLQLLEGDDPGTGPLGAPPAPTAADLKSLEERLLGEVGQRLDGLPNATATQGELESVWRELQSLEQRLTTAVAQRLQDLEGQLAQPQSVAASPADGAMFQRALDDLEQRLGDDIRRLAAAGPAPDAGAPAGAADTDALRQEMSALEQRMVSDMRENIQVFANSLRGMRTELTALNTSVNDLMQRFVNIERRLAQHEQRLDGLDPQ